MAATIDADTHVIETERTWEYMSSVEQAYRPTPVQEESQDGRVRELWEIDGKRFNRRGNVGLDTSLETREMLDVEKRLRHMDELNVDVHVLYPSLFLRPLTTRPEVELALCHGYNRWLADIWSQGHGRLRWVAVLPMLSMDEALQELRWATDHGACGVFMRGFECEKRPTDPYFYPLFEEASRLNVPLAFHAGIGSAVMIDIFGEETFSKFKFPVINAFFSFVVSRVQERFPELRVGFIESSSQWVPYQVHYLALARHQRAEELRGNLLRDNRLYVACQTDDDIPYVLNYAGEDNLLIGSDYGHADTSSELEALRHLKESGAVASGAVEKIVANNPKTFYGL